VRPDGRQPWAGSVAASSRPSPTHGIVAPSKNLERSYFSFGPPEVASQFVSQGLVDETSLKQGACYSFDFDPTNRILRFCLKGRITDESMKDLYKGMREPAHRTQPDAGVSDTSTVISFEVSSKSDQATRRHFADHPESRLSANRHCAFCRGLRNDAYVCGARKWDTPKF